MELNFLSAFFLTNVLEMPAAFFLLRKTEGAKLIFPAIFLLNCLTLPFVWFVFPSFLQMPYLSVLLLSEIFAFAVEMAAYAIIFSKTSRLTAIFAAFIANAVSFAIGFALQF